MQPGLSRAVPVAILAFLGTCVFVIVLRYLQSLDPLFDAGVAMVPAAFVTTFAFIWGMGAANPSLQTHPHAPEVDAETGLIIPADHHEDEHVIDEDEPLTVLGYSIWQISFLVIALLVIIGGFALLPTGFTLQISSDPDANTAAVGSESWVIPVLDVETQLSQLAAFAILFIVIMAGLFAVAGGIGLMMTALNAGVKEVSELETSALPAPASKTEVQAASAGLTMADYGKFIGLAVVLYLLLYYVFVGVPIEEPTWIRAGLSAFFALIFAANFTIRPLLLNTLGGPLLNVLLFLGVAGALYTAFYYVLIGVPLSAAGSLRTMLSVVNALLFAVIIVYPQWVIHTIGRTAGTVAKALRDLPAGLGQK